MGKSKQKYVVKKKWNMYRVLGLISDILIYPMLILSLVSSLSMFVSKKENRVKPILGISVVQILSPSMENAGLMTGQTVFIKSPNVDSLVAGEKGSIIAFYYYRDSADYNANFESTKEPLYLLGEEPEDMVNLNIDYSSRATIDDLADRQVKVYFHRIVAVYVNSAGTKYFETRGDGHPSDDYLIREDFVVGEYIYTPVFVREALSFCSTSLGMICIVVVPLSLLICMQLLSLLEQVSALLLEKKVLKKSVPFDAPDAIASNICIELRLADKVYFYSVVVPSRQGKVKDYLWEYMAITNKKSNKLFLNNAMKSVPLFEISPDAYFSFWRATAMIPEAKLIRCFEKYYIQKEKENNGEVNAIPFAKIEVKPKRRNKISETEKVLSQLESFRQGGEDGNEHNAETH